MQRPCRGPPTMRVEFRVQHVQSVRGSRRHTAIARDRAPTSVYAVYRVYQPVVPEILVAAVAHAGMLAPDRPTPGGASHEATAGDADPADRGPGRGGPGRRRRPGHTTQ